MATVVRTQQPWPRDHVVSSAVHTLRGRRSVLLFGATGMGKSHVSTEIARALEASGSTVVRITAARDSGDLLWRQASAPPKQGSPEIGDGRRVSAPFVQVSRDTLASYLDTIDDAIVIVDDAHEIDPEDVRWLTSAAREHRFTVLATLADDTDIAHPLLDVFLELWLDGDADRLDLEPLSRAETDDLIRSILGERIIDVATRAAIHHDSGGLPLLVTELANAAVAGSRVAAGGGPLAAVGARTTRRINHIVLSRMRPLTADERVALLVLGRLDGIPVDRAARYVGNDTLSRLFDSGFIRSGPGINTVTHTHRIETTVLSTTTDGARARRLTQHVRREIVSAFRRGVALDPFEHLFAVGATHAGGPDLDRDTSPEVDRAGATAEEWARLCLVAAAKSLSSGAPDDAARFARDSFESSPSVAAIVEESRALGAIGNFAGASELLDTTAVLEPSREEALAVMRWRVQLDTWLAPQRRVPDALESLAAALTAADTTVIRELDLAMQAMLAMEWRTSRAHAHAVLDEPTADVSSRLAANGIASIASALLGRGAELAATIARGEELVRLARLPIGSDAYLVARRDIDDYRASACFARTIAADDIIGVRDRLAEFVDRAVRRGDSARVAIAGFLVGYIEMCRGDLESSESELTAAAARQTVLPDARWQVWTQALLARVLRHRGRARDADAVIEGLSNWPWCDTRWRHSHTDWARQPLGGATSGEESSEMIPGMTLDTAGAIYQLLFSVLADVDEGPVAASVAEKARAFRAETDLPAYVAMADFVIAVADDDAAAACDSAQRLGAVGFHLLASRASERTATMFARRGMRVAAASTRAFARSVHSAGAGSESDSEGEALTGREQEIVDLVIAGKSNKQIAEALFLSVRTVESHIYHARVKLGAPSRAQLRARATV
ncbi:LuxR C-terminal-related transcriptional regulator [Marisediminicola sp. LYQ134]|uniref:helix-turn-helix transcriptional regulator n=1 Tax=Marisediminicola sp. LYQ134 TaxID=3391061 RepID=UPI0039832E1A